MPCNLKDHNHVWPEAEDGELVIEKCERYCGYCDGANADHEWKFPWFLRRHVRAVHGVTVSGGW